MEIKSAKDYGYRKVFVGVENPKDPEWVHADGKAHSDATAMGVETDKTTGAATLVSKPGLKAGTECHACIQNWKRHEYTFTGDAELKKLNAVGALINKSDQDFLDEITAMAAAEGVGAVATDLTSIVGKTV